MSTTGRKMIYGYYPEKRYTRAPQYIEDMLNDLKRLRSSSTEPRNAEILWAIKDRALGTMCVYSPREIAAIGEKLPILYDFMKFREEDSPRVDFSFDATSSPHYRPLRTLLAIATSANEALKAHKRYDFFPESILNLLAEQINIISECIPQHFTLKDPTSPLSSGSEIINQAQTNSEKLQSPATEQSSDPEKESTAKLNPFVPGWFKSLCSINKVDLDLPANINWNLLKKDFTPKSPLKATPYQAIIHENFLYYSDIDLTEKEWLKYFSCAKAKKITSKTFKNYISNIRKSQTTPKGH